LKKLIVVVLKKKIAVGWCLSRSMAILEP